MNSYFKEKLKDRLEYCLDWRKNTEIYLLSKNLTATVNYEYYKKRPLIKFVLKIYFLPINLLHFLQILRIKRDLDKNLIEIKYIKSQLLASDKLNAFKKITTKIPTVKNEEEKKIKK